MKKQKIEFKNKNIAELSKMLKENEQKLTEVILNKNNQKNKDVHQGKKIRIEIARIKTILSIKESNI